MTDHETQNTSDQPITLEDRWVEIFESHGVDSNQADLLTKSVLGHSSISKGRPSEDELRDIVDDALDELPFSERLDEKEDPGQVREELLSALESAIGGTLVGPLTAPADIAFNTPDVTPPGGGITGPAVNASNGSQRDTGLAAETQDDSPDEVEIREIQSFLERIIDEQELDPEAVKEAAKRLDVQKE